MLFLCCLPFSLKFTFTPNIYTFGCKFFDLGKSKGFLNLHLLETQGAQMQKAVRQPSTEEARAKAKRRGNDSLRCSERMLSAAKIHMYAESAQL